uniref:Zinc finger BED domain-containing protein 1 n=1 Tax=Cacopsylla melanoneura TaxID=428564 RepID=A0A8D9EFA7_9HEMI
MSRRNKSIVWDYFSKDNDGTVQCTICNAIYKNCGNTSNLRSHLLQKHPTDVPDHYAGTSKRSKKKKFKTEVEDPSYDNHNVLSEILNEDYHYGTTPGIATQHKSKKWEEPNTDRIVFEKVSIPTGMKSIYWKHFGFPADGNGEILSKQKVICCLCSTQFSYAQNTTNIKKHLERKHPIQYKELHDRVGLPVDEPLVKRKKNKDEYQVVNVKPVIQEHYSICVQGDQGEQAIISIPQQIHHDAKKATKKSAISKSVEHLIFQFIVRDLESPSVINSAGFRHLMLSLSPKYDLPTEQTIIQELVPKMYDTLKNAMYNDITAINMTDNVFSLGLEHWEANDREYISYYINYLQNEENFATRLLHTFLLDPDSLHNTFHHQEMFNIVCSSWNIKTSNIKAVIISSDNTSLHQAVVNQEIPVIPCLDHTLSQICLKAFEKPAIKKLIRKSRVIISRIYNKNNFALEVTFPDPNSETEDDTLSTFLSLDNPYVWLSTLNMLEALNAARSKLNVLLEVGEEYSEVDEVLNEEEWTVLARVVQIFNPIKVTVTTLSEEKPARASLILPLYLQLVNCHLNIHPQDDALTQELKLFFVNSLKVKYTSVDSFLQICTALDPRVKKLPYIEQHDVFGGPITEMLLAIEPPISETSKYYTDVIEPETKKNVRLSGMEFLLGNVTSTPSPPVNTSLPSHAENIAHEISQYSRCTPASLNQCPLSWWRDESNRFSNVYPLALKYNCVPATSVASSKAMEMKARCTYLERRKLLSLNTQAVLNHLLFLHHNYTLQGDQI